MPCVARLGQALTTKHYEGGESMRARSIVAWSLVAVVSIGGVGFVLGNPAPASLSASRLGQAPDIELSFDESTAVVTAVDEFSTTRTDAQVISQAEVSFSPQRVLMDGEWVPVSNELSVNERGRLEAERHSLNPEFADVSSDNDLVSFSHGGYDISLSLAGVDRADGTQVGESGE